MRELDRFKLYRARSRLYRSQTLQVNMRLKALAEIYTMHSFAQLRNHIFSKMAKKESGKKKMAREPCFGIISFSEVHERDEDRLDVVDEDSVVPREHPYKLLVRGVEDAVDLPEAVRASHVAGVVQRRLGPEEPAWARTSVVT